MNLALALRSLRSSRVPHWYRVGESTPEALRSQVRLRSGRMLSDPALLELADLLASISTREVSIREVHNNTLARGDEIPRRRIGAHDITERNRSASFALRCRSESRIRQRLGGTHCVEALDVGHFNL